MSYKKNMCGIVCRFGKTAGTPEERALFLHLSSLLRHRGPDSSGIYIGPNAIMCHERLAIVDPNGDSQPLYNMDRTIILCINGEIYNHQPLRTQYCAHKTFRTGSDCEPIVHMYEDMEPGRLCSLLDGDFAFALASSTSYLAARDPTGVCPLYYGYDDENRVWFASELKALEPECVEYYVFPPGHYWTPESGFVRYFNPKWVDTVPTSAADLSLLRITFIAAVEKRLMSDVPYGILLSGGLDSSLVASVATKIINQPLHPLHTFSIGLPSSSDLPYAKRVADYLGTIHHEFHFTVQEGLDAIRDVIWHLETFDCTTIRASTPMFLLSRKIRSLGIKMVLSGEGSDEIFGGYLYFHLAPDGDAMHHELVSRVQNLHLADNLRANKSTMAWGLEARVPFLDAAFLDVAMSVDPREKLHRPLEQDETGQGRIEKYILRKAFEGWLPDDILWRQKEQFSDGVGYSWIDSLKAFADSQVSDQTLAQAKQHYRHLTPVTKESYWYRTIFDELFHTDRDGHNAEQTVKTWTPKWSLSQDPSGRAQRVHMASLAAV